MTPTTPRHSHYDVVVVGARVAGASTAMLMARAGLRVLVVDRQPRGADTLSTHALMRGGVWQLHRWGVLKSITEATPPITEAVFVYGGREVRLPIAPDGSGPGLYAPRRTLLDPVLVDAACDAGAEVLHGPRFVDVVRDRHGAVRGVELVSGDRRMPVASTVRADLVVGADGLGSAVARSVGASTYRRGEHGAATIYAYVHGLDDPSYDTCFVPGLGAGVIPTGGGLACVFTSMPADYFAHEARGAVETTWRRVLTAVRPATAAAVERARVVGPLRTFPGRAGHFRQPTGPGWALVGDAGHYNDSITAHGITGALRDAELLVAGVLEDDAGSFRCRRDEIARPIFDVTDRIASFGWTLDELQALHIELSQAFRRETEIVSSWGPHDPSPTRELLPCP